MKEKADAILVPTLAQCLSKRHQLIIMHPDEVIRPKHLMQLAREVIIDTQITAQIPARELGEIDAVVQKLNDHEDGWYSSRIYLSPFRTAMPLRDL